MDPSDETMDGDAPARAPQLEPRHSHGPFDRAPLAVVDGRYRILGRLGAGAMGIVYHAVDVLLDRPAALKVLEPGLAATPAAAESLLREARALARLRHDNVVQIYAFGSYEGLFYFAMEYVEGETVADLLNRNVVVGGTAVPLATALEIVRSVAAGLSAAHARNLIHRDVKPSNIVLERGTERPVLVDFGIAREVETPSPKASLSTSGTPAYMAPEQVRNDRARIGRRVDVYALACTAFELLSGRAPFEHEDPYLVLLDHVSTPAPALSRFCPAYGALDVVFAKALAKEPDDRHDSCDAFAAELSAAAKRVGLIGDPSTPPQEAAADAAPPPGLTAAAARPLVLVLAADDGLRRAVVRETDRRYRRIGATPRVECMTLPDALVDAFAREPAALVIVDDDCAEGASLALVQRLRATGSSATIMVLTRGMLGDRETWEAVGARRVAKPLNLRVLAAALDQVPTE